ncbi:hypothetical protein PVAP13_4KG365501, partial [Panicum virgatum]
MEERANMKKVRCRRCKGFGNFAKTCKEEDEGPSQPPKQKKTRNKQPAKKTGNKQPAKTKKTGNKQPAKKKKTPIKKKLKKAASAPEARVAKSL